MFRQTSKRLLSIAGSGKAVGFRQYSHFARNQQEQPQQRQLLLDAPQLRLMLAPPQPQLLLDAPQRQLMLPLTQTQLTRTSSSIQRKKTALEFHDMFSLFHLKHNSEKQRQSRAEAFENHLQAERKIIAATDIGLTNTSNVTSPEMMQSSWMAHVQRGGFSKMDNQQEERDKLAAQYRSNNVPFAKVSPGAREAAAMMVRGEAGPFTREQSALGAELALTGHLLRKKLTPETEKSLGEKVLEADRGIDEMGKKSHQTTSPGGMNLSPDFGTYLRDRLRLPVMSGTSGTTSRMVLSHLQESAKQGVSPMADGLNRKRGKMAVIDLAFHYMRKGALPQAVAEGINSNRENLGLPKKTVIEDRVQTHSYPEVAAAVDMAVGGKVKTDRHSLKRSTLLAQKRLKDNR